MRRFDDVCEGDEVGPQAFLHAKDAVRAYARAADHYFPRFTDDEGARRVAWLSNLQYWLILLLLDTAYRGQLRKLRYKAIDGMTHGLWQLGHHLANRWQVGMPFDQMAPIYTLGRDQSCALKIIGLLAREAELRARECERDGLLPEGFDVSTLGDILDGLAHPGLSAVGPPRTVGA